MLLRIYLFVLLKEICLLISARELLRVILISSYFDLQTLSKLYSNQNYLYVYIYHISQIIRQHLNHIVTYSVHSLLLRYGKSLDYREIRINPVRFI